MTKGWKLNPLWVSHRHNVLAAREYIKQQRVAYEHHVALEKLAAVAVTNKGH